MEQFRGEVKNSKLVFQKHLVRTTLLNYKDVTLDQLTESSFQNVNLFFHQNQKVVLITTGKLMQNCRSRSLLEEPSNARTNKTNGVPSINK
jgi:hypothetical protein